MGHRLNTVLVHGAWADGSSWSAVIERLQGEGYHVIAPQFPMTSLADDVARLRQVLEFQDGPTVVVGHSYGGQVMTALGPRRAQRRRPELHSSVCARAGRISRSAVGAGPRDPAGGLSVRRLTVLDGDGLVHQHARFSKEPLKEGMNHDSHNHGT